MTTKVKTWIIQKSSCWCANTDVTFKKNQNNSVWFHVFEGKKEKEGEKKVCGYNGFSIEESCLWLFSNEKWWWILCFFQKLLKHQLLFTLRTTIKNIFNRSTLSPPIYPTLKPRSNLPRLFWASRGLGPGIQTLAPLHGSWQTQAKDGCTHTSNWISFSLH